MNSPDGKASSLDSKEPHQYRFLFDTPFKFIIGPTKQEVYVHPGRMTASAALGLHKLITSPLKEGLEGEAELPEDDITTFLHFCQWMYSGFYTLAETKEFNGPRELSDYTKPFHGLSDMFCRYCRGTTKTSQLAGDLFPFCSEACRTTIYTTYRNPKQFCAKCNRQLPITDNYTASMPALCQSCEVEQQGRNRLVLDWPQCERKNTPLQKRIRANMLADTGLSKEFLQLQLDQAHRPCGEGQFMSTRTSKEMPTEDLVQHARLFVFADKWCIKHLERLALCNLHRDLCTFKLSAANVSRIVELIDYVYANTPSPDIRGVPAAQKSLRELMVAYVEELAHELIEYHDFQSMLMDIPELAVWLCEACKETKTDLVEPLGHEVGTQETHCRLQSYS